MINARPPRGWIAVFAAVWLLATGACSGVAPPNPGQPPPPGGRPPGPPPGAPPPQLVASPVVAPISSPRAAKTTALRFDDSAGPAGAGWTIRAEPGAASPPNAICQSDDQPATYLVGDATSATADRFVDGKITTRVKTGANHNAGLIFRAQDQRTYYLVRLEPARIAMYYVANNVEKPIASRPLDLAPNVWREFRGTIADNTIFIWVDNQQVLSGADDTLTRPGLAGFWAGGGSGACFDDVAVEWR